MQAGLWSGLSLHRALAGPEGPAGG